MWTRPRRRRGLSDAFAAVASTFDMTFSAHVAGPPRRVVILASGSGHCLGDLLVRDALGELTGPGGFDGRVVAVIANHDTQRALTDRFAIPFHHVPHEGDRAASERRVGELLEEYQPDLVVLRRATC